MFIIERQKSFPDVTCQPTWRGMCWSSGKPHSCPTYISLGEVYHIELRLGLQKVQFWEQGRARRQGKLSDPLDGMNSDTFVPTEDCRRIRSSIVPAWFSLTGLHPSNPRIWFFKKVCFWPTVAHSIATLRIPAELAGIAVSIPRDQRDPLPILVGSHQASGWKRKYLLFPPLQIQAAVSRDSSWCSEVCLICFDLRF